MATPRELEIGTASALAVGRAIFEFRKSVARTPLDTHVMTFSTYEWGALPIGEQNYYADMALAALRAAREQGVV